MKKGWGWYRSALVFVPFAVRFFIPMNWPSSVNLTANAPADHLPPGMDTVKSLNLASGDPIQSLRTDYYLCQELDRIAGVYPDVIADIQLTVAANMGPVDLRNLGRARSQ